MVTALPTSLVSHFLDMFSRSHTPWVHASFGWVLSGATATLLNHATRCCAVSVCGVRVWLSRPRAAPLWLIVARGSCGRKDLGTTKTTSANVISVHFQTPFSVNGSG